MPALLLWPTAPVAVAESSAAIANVYQRWIIVDGSARHEVSERDFRGALGTCARIEVARYPHDPWVTHICYR